MSTLQLRAKHLELINVLGPGTQSRNATKEVLNLIAACGRDKKLLIKELKVFLHHAKDGIDYTEYRYVIRTAIYDLEH